MRTKQSKPNNLRYISFLLTPTIPIIPTLSIISLLSLSPLLVPFQHDTSALTYGQSETVQFTFNPTISVTVSGDLIIDKLAVSDSADSNIINVDVNTNSVGGYTLAATVGSPIAGNINHNTDLNNVDASSNVHKFNGLATNAEVADLTSMTAGYWGYSYSTDNGTTWISNPTGTLGYSGLPLDNDDSGATGKILLETNHESSSNNNSNNNNNNDNNGDSIKFKVGASALPTQTSGAYTNTIHFYAIAKPEPPKAMQYIDTWKSELANIGDEVQAVDIRDGNTYWVAKLADGNIWMTQNLDLCIGCTGTATLDSTNTDLNKSGSGAYTNGYTVSGSVITWTPSGTTVTGTPAIINYENKGVSGWSNTTTAPRMAEGDTEYVVEGTPYANKAACMENTSEEVCERSHVGNYYNWTAAIASNASGSITERYATADNSICPRGWRLPKGPDGTNGSEFEQMLKAAGIANPNNTDNGSGSEVNVGYIGGGNLSSTNMEKSPYYFARSGLVGGTTLYNFTSDGYYWSGSAVSGSVAFDLNYGSSVLYPADQHDRDGGWSLRCLAR